MKRICALLIAGLFLFSGCSWPSPVIPVTGNDESLEPAVEVELATSIPDEEPEGMPEEPPAGTTLTWFDQSEFVYVPGGEFVMGRDVPGGADYSPAHAVSLFGFWIQRTEVTNQQYGACVAAGQCSPPVTEAGEPDWYADPAKLDSPVVNVSWEQAQAYCLWIDARLPTEAEWEKSSRGVDARLYPWGNTEPTCELANYNGCIEPVGPAAVASYPFGISPYKLDDMTGNVFEWVSDWYAEEYYLVSPASNPRGPEIGTHRVIRGGGYASVADELDAALRFAEQPDEHRPDLGFRCVLTGRAPAPFCVVPLVRSGGSPSDPTPPVAWDFDIEGYCEEREKGQFTGVNFTVFGSEDDLLNYTYDAKIDEINLTCSPYALGKYSCYGAILHQGSTPDVRVCRERTGPPIPDPEATCPDGYVFNPELGYCDDVLPRVDEGGGCPAGFVFTEIGCVPLPSASGCPAGFMLWTDFDICWPLDSCMVPYYRDAHLGVCDSYCWGGTVYDPDEDCCQVEMPELFCPIGYVWSDCTNSCVLYEYLPNLCNTGQVYIPVCPTPTPHEPPPQTCYCCQFTTFGDCMAQSNFGCTWVSSPVGAAGGYCAGP